MNNLPSMNVNSSLNESFYENCSYFNPPDVSNSPGSKAANMIWMILPPIFLLIGIPGNIITMLVIFRQRKTMTSTAVFLGMLAITDTIFLLIGNLVDWFMTMSWFSFRETNDAVCKLLNFLYYWSAQCSSWILVAITVERIISLVFPHHYRRICTKMVSQIACLVIGILLFALNTHFFYGFGISDTYLYLYGSSCGPLELDDYQLFYFDIWPWLDLTFLFAIPFVILSVGNSIILYKLVKMKSAASKTLGSGGNKKGHRSTESIMVLILFLNFVFVICLTPLSLFLTSEKAIHSWADEVMCIDEAEYEYRNGVVECLLATVVCLSYINPSVNFILYVLSSTKFRGEIKALLTCKPVGRENAFFADNAK